MVRIAKAYRSRYRSVSGGLVVCLLCGCGAKRVDSIRLANDTLGPMTIAVAPALNVSGSSDFDPNRVAFLDYIKGLSERRKAVVGGGPGKSVIDYQGLRGTV